MIHNITIRLSPKVEISMFNTFGNNFYKRYDELKKIEDGFWQERVHIYNLFPYLVHVRAFGGGYLHGVESILKRIGY